MSIKTRLEWLEKKQPAPLEMFCYRLTNGAVLKSTASPLDIAHHPPEDCEVCAWLNPPALKGQDPLSDSLVSWMAEIMRDGGRSFREEIKNLRSDDVPTR